MANPARRRERGESWATEAAALRAAALLAALIDRGVGRDDAAQIVLWCVLGLFAEGVGVSLRPVDLPPGLDLPELTARERALFEGVAAEDWTKVEPAIFGELLQRSMAGERRRALGAHFTRESDIQKIIGPTIARPFEERLGAARSPAALCALRAEVRGLRVLDPACGTGNFLYVAYRALVRLELVILRRLREVAREGAGEGSALSVSLSQLHGIDVDPAALSLARITLRFAERLAQQEAEREGVAAPSGVGVAEADLRCADALFCAWPEADVIIGNPPFQAKNKLRAAYGPAYRARLRERYPEVSGLSDYCVYWFRRAHDELRPGGRAGLVGTNTIRQNTSREGGLDHIVKGGTITEAVSTQAWAGDARVHVSIVNWVKGEAPGKKRLWVQEGSDPAGAWRALEVPFIPASLSVNVDVSAAARLEANARAGVCYQGQTHGHEGFLLTPAEAERMIRARPEDREVLFPLLIAADLLGRRDARPSRHVIDFHPRDEGEARRHAALFARVEARVLPSRRLAEQREEAQRGALGERAPRREHTLHHRRFMRAWWQLSWPRPELVAKLGALPRYIACARVMKRPVFEFISAAIRPGDALQVFALADDYSFGVLQSDLHFAWLTERGSTLKGDYRYTSSSVFDTFPWPQNPGERAVRAVAEAAVALRQVRWRLLAEQGICRRALYRALEEPAQRALREAHGALDARVREAYGMEPGEGALGFLLELNRKLAAREAAEEEICGPGIPRGLCAGVLEFVSADCILD